MSPGEALAAILTITVAGAFLCLFAAGFGFILSKIGGWGQLSEQYRTNRSFPTPKWRFQSGGLGVIRYNFILTVAADQDGLYLVPMFPIRLTHMPLFIPWKDVTWAKGTNWLAAWVLTFKATPKIQFKIGHGLEGRLSQWRT